MQNSALRCHIQYCNLFGHDLLTPNDLLEFALEENTANIAIKSDINNILTLAKLEQLELIKKLILAVL